MNLFFPHGNRVLQSPMHALAAEQSDAEAEEPCRAPAMANGRCRLHGGKSTGPRTPEGLERSRRARLVHGYYTAEAKAARAEARRTMRAFQLLLREAKSE